MNAFIFIGWRFFFAGFAGLSASAISLAEELPPGELVGASEEIVRAARIAATSAASEEAAAALEVLGRAASAGDPSGTTSRCQKISG